MDKFVNGINKFKSQSLAKFVQNPIYIILFVSDKCWQKCSHCWYSADWKRENLEKKNLTFDELELISKSIKRLEFLSITGGDAFLREEIVEIFDVFNKNSKIHRFDTPTSGFDPDRIILKTEQILKKLDGKPFRVDVSLDGTEEVHNSIRKNKHSYKNAVTTIKELNKLKKKHDNFDTSIITTISKTNMHEVETMAALVDDLLPTGEWMINIARPATVDGCTASDNELLAYKKANTILEGNIKNGFHQGDKGHKFGKFLTAKNQVRREYIDKIIKGKKHGLSCSAGSLIGVIFNDGQVRPCETLPDTIANIRDFDYDLIKLWQSQKAAEIRKKIIDTKCMCSHECFLSVSLLVHGKSLLKILGKSL